jgi:enoyl-CoA hydratase
VQEAETEPPGRSWDSVADLRFMRPYVDAFLRLWNHPKPTIAGVQGWCIGGGSDMVMCADLVMAAEGAIFGYPPVRVWGMPTTPMWIHRLGTQYAKRYLLTGDEIPAATAERIGLTFETVPDDELHHRARVFARWMALLPLNQLMMVKMYCNQVIDSTGVQPQTSFATILDGIARHTQEGVDFTARADDVGFRQAVRDRDDPFGDYGSRPRPERP